MTLIIFIGSVFSPYYAAARQRDRGAPENHCAFNMILYGPGTRKRWSMTERSSRAMERQPDTLRIGPSRVHWDGQTLVADIDERCNPLPRRMRGRVTVTPTPLTGHSVWLDDAGRHRWHPLAPIARVSVDMQAPGVRWEGRGYLDSNEGNEPLEKGFRGWDWSRESLPDGDCQVRYETRREGAQPRRLSLRFGADGSLQTGESEVSSAVLPTTNVWRIPRRTLTDPQSPWPRVLRTLEDTPFYARSLMGLGDGDTLRHAVHESLCLKRFEQRWVQTLLPFRMPRWR
jgi:carotenoid 1,2-hydratase